MHSSKLSCHFFNVFVQASLDIVLCSEKSQKSTNTDRHEPHKNRGSSQWFWRVSRSSDYIHKNLTKISYAILNFSWLNVCLLSLWKKIVMYKWHSYKKGHWRETFWWKYASSLHKSSIDKKIMSDPLSPLTIKSSKFCNIYQFVVHLNSHKVYSLS